MKVSFTASSGGLTQYDGAWEMEQMFVPNLGTRWTAKTEGYSTTQIQVAAVQAAKAAVWHMPTAPDANPAGAFPIRNREIFFH